MKKNCREMNLPTLTAEASLYRSSKHYPATYQAAGETPTSREFVPAYYPTYDVVEQCNSRLDGCGGSFLGCLLFTWGNVGVCLGEIYSCWGEAHIPGAPGFFSPCCPKLCSPGDYAAALAQDPNLIVATGCCDADEHCVDRNDPQARDGCCPADQAVCGGKCCSAGDNCCGDTCCDPSSSVCMQGVCCPTGTPTVCNGQCCDGPCDGQGNCCPSPSHLCGSECCAGLSPCCNGVCCELGSVCVAGSCCPQNQVCGDTCCPPGSKCDDPTTGRCSACPPGTQAVHCGSPDEILCCPPGTSVCCGGKCCAAGEECCGDPLACHPGYVCIQ